jgi:single-strand DNA-binding protein
MNWQITSTATVLGEPKLTEGDITFAAVATKLVQNAAGEVLQSNLLFFVTYAGKRVAELAPRIVKGSRLAFEGFFLGNAYGGPIIWESKDGSPYTGFSVEATDVRVIAPPAKKGKEEVVSEDITSVLLVGNFGRDAELRMTPAGDFVCQSSLATNRAYKDENGEFQKSTVWFRLTIWRDAAERASKWWTKGKKIIAKVGLYADPKTGAPSLWQAQDGSTRANYEATVYTWEFAAPKGDSSSTPLPEEERSLEAEDSEIPF